MSDIQKALADIGDIRLRLAAGTVFRGFGPTVIAVSGGLAIALASAQSVWGGGDAIAFLGAWVAVAVVSAVLIGLETGARTRRHHGGLADAMLINAVEHFLPFGAAGAVVAGIVLRFAPDIAWILPGLWQMTIGLGLFAACRFLPRAVAIAAAWYFLAGAGALIFASDGRALSPWSMGLPFGAGQAVLALILHVAREDADGR